MTPADVAEAVAHEFESAALEAIEARGRFACAVPGGSVAEHVFPRLAALRLPWPRIDVFWVDERHVPPDDPDANVRAAREYWFDRLTGPPPRLHPMAGAARPLAEAAALAEADLVATLGEPPRLDMAMLGVGPDGHVASLFPGHDAVARRDRRVLPVTGAPKPPPLRLTMSQKTLTDARAVWFIAFGGGKAAVVHAARTDPGSQLPVALVARGASRVRWFLDEAAAGGP